MNENLTIAFTGDIAFSKYFDGAWSRDFIARGVFDFLQSADYVVGNIEAPITNEAISSKRSLNHVNNPECINVLKKLNINIWNLANNHIMDCQANGLHSTLKYANEEGINVIGAGIDVNMASETIIVGEQLKVGMLAFTMPLSHVIADNNKPGALTWKNIELIKAKIKALRDKVNYIVLNIHGGEEFSQMPMPYIRDLYHKFLDLGADIIVGHHPHVTQNYEIVGKKIIYYSLGNFIFDTDYQRIQKNSDIGVLLKLNFTKDGYDFIQMFTKINREENRIEETNRCPVFCDINEADYQLLWPFAAKDYDKAHRKAIMYRNKRFKNRPNLLLIVNFLRNLTREDGRILIKGMFKALFKGGHVTNNRHLEILDYIGH